MFSRFFYPVAKLMLIFATLIVLAFRSRSNPPAHKRLILVGIPAVCLVASLNLTSKAFVSLMGRQSGGLQPSVGRTADAAVRPCGMGHASGAVRPGGYTGVISDKA